MEAINNNLSRHGKDWTPVEDAQLRKLRQTHTFAELGQMLGRTESGVKKRCYLLNLRKCNYGIVLTEQQEKLLKEYYPRMMNIPLAKLLGLSERTMRRRAKELGLEKAPNFRELNMVHIVEKIKRALQNTTKDFRKHQFRGGHSASKATEFKPGHRMTEAEKEKMRATRKRNKRLKELREKYYNN